MLEITCCRSVLEVTCCRSVLEVTCCRSVLEVTCCRSVLEVTCLHSLLCFPVDNINYNPNAGDDSFKNFLLHRKLPMEYQFLKANIKKIEATILTKRK